MKGDEDMMTTIRWLFVLSIVIGLAACDGGDDGGGAVKDLVLAGDAESEMGSQEGLPDLAGRVYLFSSLETFVPTDMFNSTWQKDLDSNAIVIMLRVHTHDTATDVLTMSVVTGAAVADPDTGDVMSYHPSLEGTPLEVTLEDGAFELDETFKLDIMTENLSFPLHLVDLTGHGEILLDGSGMKDSYFVGGLLESDMMIQCMGVAGLGAVNLQWFLTLGGLCPDRDTDGDGTLDAYTFDWHFDAVEITDLYEEDIIVVPTAVTDCVPHMDGCAGK